MRLSVSGAGRSDSRLVAVAGKFFTAPVAFGIATGLSFPDALSVGGLLGHAGLPLIRVAGTTVPTPVIGYVAGGQRP